MRAFIAAALTTLASTSYAEGPRSYGSLDFRAGTVSPSVGSYNYVGFDVYGGRRLLQWLAVEGFYAADLGDGAYPYPAECAQICCGSHLRSWNTQELGARVVFVPLHLRFLDVSAGFGVAGILAREKRGVSPEVPASLGCGGAFDGLRGGIAGSTFMSMEVRPIAHFGLRVTGIIGIADVEDYPIFQFAAGPVVWF